MEVDGELGCRGYGIGMVSEGVERGRNGQEIWILAGCAKPEN